MGWHVNQASYSDWELKTITELAAKGDSASQIGKAIGRTRNAVIGKCARMGIPLGSSLKLKMAAAKTLAPRQFVAPKPIPVKLVAPKPAPKPTPKPVRAFTPPPICLTPDQMNGCQWPVGNHDHGDYTVCGAEKAYRTAYCDHHHRKAHQGAAPRPRPSLTCTMAEPYRQIPGEIVR